MEMTLILCHACLHSDYRQISLRAMAQRPIIRSCFRENLLGRRQASYTHERRSQRPKPQNNPVFQRRFGNEMK